MEKTPHARNANQSDLRLAASRLAEPGSFTSYVCGIPETVTTPSLIEQLEVMITGSAGAPRGGATGAKAGSRPPMDIESLNFRDEIRGTANQERIEHATGEHRHYFDTAEAVLEWAIALNCTARMIEKAGTDDAAITKAITRATRLMTKWAARIEAMVTPPIVKELTVPCWVCDSAAFISTDEYGKSSISRPLVLRVREGSSVLECRACGSRMTDYDDLIATGASLQGKTEAQIRRAVADATRKARGAAVTRKQPADQTILELQAYTSHHGHLPTAGSTGTAQEKRLTEWIRNRTKGEPKTDKGKATRAALDQILTTIPSKREWTTINNAQASAA